MKTLDEVLMDQSQVERCHLIVRVRSSYWHDNKGIYSKKEIKRLSRKSIGPDFLVEEASNVGASETFPLIINLHECEDGIYEVITVNITRDYETGYADGWDFKLIPYKVNP